MTDEYREAINVLSARIHLLEETVISCIPPRAIRRSLAESHKSYSDQLDRTKDSDDRDVLQKILEHIEKYQKQLG